MSENPQDPTAPSDQPPPQPYNAPPPPPPPMSDQPPAYGQPAPAYGAQAQAPVSPSDARMWSLLAHIGGIFFSFVPALVIYVIYKDRDPLIRRHAAQALNFQIIIAIAFAISWILTAVLIGFFLLFVVWIWLVIFSIIAAMAANRGEEYTYPLIPQMVT